MTGRCHTGHLLAGLIAILVCSGVEAGVQILSAETLAKELSRWSIVDARDSETFEKGHIPASRNMEWKEWTAKRPGLLNYLFGSPAEWGKVPEPTDSLRNRLEAEGLSHNRPIVVVGKPAGWGDEGRIAWNLLYWGAKDVALLDGGYAAWTSNKERPVETGMAKPTNNGNFLLSLQRERRADKAAILDSLPQTRRTLLDARSPEEFSGKTVKGQKRGGHIPGAISVPVTALYQPNGHYLSAEALQQIAGASLKNPIAYCVGGVRSALLALLIEARLGTVVANYDGSIWEWSSDAELPLTK